MFDTVSYTRCRKDIKMNKCKCCGYESEQNYEGYCFQCACEKGIEENPFKG